MRSAEKLRKGLAAVTALLASGLPAAGLHAHPGGLDARGCHVDRKSGGYHCHRAPQAQPNPAVPSGGTGDEPYFRTCEEARNARTAPIRRGNPGYRPALDRDGDGIACE